MFPPIIVCTCIVLYKYILLLILHTIIIEVDKMDAWVILKLFAGYSIVSGDM